MTQHEHIKEELLEEAMDWFLRLREPSRAQSDESAFVDWINRSAQHERAWAKACHTWDVMGETRLADVSARRAQPAARTRQLRRFGRRRAIGAGIAAVAACLLVMVIGPGLLTRYEADHTTGTAETRRIMLEDGSTVDLGADSAIAVDFSGRERQVRLLSGEAFFDVRPDAARPFTVDAARMLDITVVGTAFDVNVTPRSASVQLAHGGVDLSVRETGTMMKLRPGDAASYDRDSGQLVRSSMPVDTMASWRDGKLFVQDVPVSAVVAQLQRYHTSWITVASSELGERRVTGLYDLTDPDRALEALVSPYRARVHHVSPYLRVLSFF